MNLKIAVLPGDGIGPEVTDAVIDLLAGRVNRLPVLGEACHV